MSRQPRLQAQGASTRVREPNHSAVERWRAALAIDSRSAAHHYNLGTALADCFEHQEAAGCFEKAMALQPDDPLSANDFGLALRALGRPECAVAQFHEALRRRPDYPEAYHNLSITLRELGRLEEALASSDRALELREQFPEAYHNRAMIFEQLGEMDAALLCYDQALALTPDQPAARYGRALALLARGAFSAGWAEYEWRWQTPQMLPSRRDFAQPQWHGEAAQHRILLIHAEQGFGDTLQFCRYVPLAVARGFRVVLEVPGPLVRLLGCLEGVQTIVPQGEALPAFDVHCPMLSLPLAFGTDMTNIPNSSPYLHADDVRVGVWQERLAAVGAAGLRVGLVWAGNPRRDIPAAAAIDRRRSVSPETLAPLFTCRDVTFFSLQKDHPPPESFSIIDVMGDVEDFADTAALIAHLDLVISVDTAVAHLAAALGKRVWLLDRFDGCWRWLRDWRDAPPRLSPWYPTMSIYRQPTQGDWAAPIADMARDLAVLSAAPARVSAAAEHFRAGRRDEAAALCEDILTVDSNNTFCLNMLGVLANQDGRPAEAVEKLRRAIDCNPSEGLFHYNLGAALGKLGHLEQAIACYREAVARMPQFDQAFYNLGEALGRQGQIAEALHCLHRATMLRPDDASYHLLYATTLLAAGYFEQGWQEFEWRWQTTQMHDYGRDYPRWRGEVWAGQTLLIHAEQGYGDTLQFCRYAPLAGALGMRVTLGVPTPLVRLLQGLPGVERVVPVADFRDFDVHCPMMSLPLAFATTLETIPAPLAYLAADPEQIRRWQERLAVLCPTRYRVGLAWAGNPRAERPDAAAVDQRRSMSAECLAPLHEISHVQFFSLQKDGSPQEAFPVIDVMGEMHDFADTAALIANLDLVISVDTAVAHLAAALGKPVWLLDRFDSCWRWLRDRRESPWYPSLRIYRQSQPGDWASVIAEVTRDLLAASERGRADSTAEALFFEGIALGKQGKLEEAVAAYRRAIDLRPTFAEAVHNLAEALGRLGQAAAAATYFRRALEVQPNFPEAANNLGVVLMHLQRPEEAMASYRLALELRPDYSDALNNLGVALAEQRRLDEAVQCYQGAIAQRPDFVQAHSNLGLALREQMRLDASIASHLRAVALQPGGALEHFNYSIALLTAGHIQAGFAEHEWRWRLPDLLPQRGFAQPQWRGEAAEGKTLLIHPEGGFGDVLQFCRYAPLAAARGLRVVIEAPKPLVRLLATLTGVETVVAAGEALPAFDLHCPIQSLALAFSTTLETIPGAAPYLQAEPRQIEVWRARLGERAAFRVGLVWAGNPLLERPEMAAMDRRRSVPPPILAPLFDIQGVCFVSLQKAGPAAPEHFPMLQFMHLVEDFADTAALIANLDLVIAVDTAVAHLAAALGKPVWLLNRFDTCWRWLTDRCDSPWYPTLRIYRQARAGDWDGPVAEMAGDLAKLVALHHRQDEALFLQGVAYGKQGEPAEAAACYRSALALRPDFPEANNNLGQALAEQGVLEAAVDCFRAALAQQEAFPEAHSNLGITFGAMGRREEAIACHRRAIELQPDNPDSHNNLGAALAQVGAWAEAAESYHRALDLRPDFVRAHYNLGILWHEQRRLPEASECFRQVVALQPDCAEAFNDLGCTLMAQRLLDEAVVEFRSSLALKPNVPDTHYNLSLALLARGDLPEGWEEYEWRWQTGHMMGQQQHFTQPQWQGEPAEGRTLLIRPEGGFGDTLQFCRYAPLAAELGWTVYVEVQPQLARLLQNLPGVAGVIACGARRPAFDMVCPMLSLPRALGTCLATIPSSAHYLQADPADCSAWAQRLRSVRSGPRIGVLRIGVLWAGNPRLHEPAHAALDRRRSISVERLAPLLALPGYGFFSLQKDVRPPAELPLIDLMSEVVDFADTAALIANLDLVIAVDSAVAHLAAALGKTVWLLDRFDSCWRWLRDREDSPWYPSLRIYRQPSDGDWDSVVARVVDDLREGAGVSRGKARGAAKPNLWKTLLSKKRTPSAVVT